jgi:hypothetical protein
LQESEKKNMFSAFDFPDSLSFNHALSQEGKPTQAPFLCSSLNKKMKVSFVAFRLKITKKLFMFQL